MIATTSDGIIGIGHFSEVAGALFCMRGFTGRTPERSLRLAGANQGCVRWCGDSRCRRCPLWRGVWGPA